MKFGNLTKSLIINNKRVPPLEGNTLPFFACRHSIVLQGYFTFDSNNKLFGRYLK